MSDPNIVRPGETAKMRFRVINNAGSPVTGLTIGDFNVSLLKDDATSGATVSLTEIASGWYTASFDPSGLGDWVLELEPTADPGPNLYFSKEFRCAIGGTKFLGRSVAKVGDTVYFIFEVQDEFGNLKSGVTFGDKFVTKDHAAQSASLVSVQEIGSTGRYYAYATPDSKAVWEYTVGDQSTGMWKAIFDVTDHGIIDSIPSSPPTVSEIRIEMDNNSTKLAHLNVDLDTRASQSSLDTVDSDVLSRAAPGDQMNLADGAITEPKFADDAISDRVLAPDVDTYQAKIGLEIDSSDRYAVKWFKNTQPIDSGVTEAKIKVVFAEDGSDLFALHDMVDVGNGRFKYDETVHRITPGEAYIARAEAMIDGQTRYGEQPLGRDSAS